MKHLNFSVKPQYVKLTKTLGQFPDGKGHYREYPLHFVQEQIKENFDDFKKFSIITAPTGTGKSYAFPLPVLKSKQTTGFGGLRGGKRGLIVLPTNALIDELHDNFTEMYKNQLAIGKITGKHLTYLLKKGYDRWREILNIAQDHDLVITNPDIINYAMHGGYHKTFSGKVGRREFHDFLEVFDYIIFDEYHLYDEAQIANIFTLTYMNEIFIYKNDRIKFLFVSATPEKGLKEVLSDLELPYNEIIENITNDSENARAIHGRLNVEIHNSRNFSSLIADKYLEIEKEIQSQRKVLIIFDTLRELQEVSEIISHKFSSYKIVKSTGYVSEDENQTEEIKTANIILATNKAEVGVNYGVEYAIMQTGKFYGNFVQRFGRVARGDLNGKIVVAIKETVQFNKLKKDIQDIEVSYYDFLHKMELVFNIKKFYAEIVPMYIGEYLWCIKNNIYKTTDYGKKIGNYNTFKTFENRIKEIGVSKKSRYLERYNLFQTIDFKIRELKKRFPRGVTVQEIENWWDTYLDTYLSFRDSSKIVQIFDEVENKELLYSLEWILQHKEVIGVPEVIKQENYEIVKYRVGDLKERDTDLQYEISTIPTLSNTPAIAMYSDLNTDKKIKILFDRNVQSLIKKQKKGWDESNELIIKLLEKIKLLSMTFTRKRLQIDNIIINNSFL